MEEPSDHGAERSRWGDIKPWVFLRCVLRGRHMFMPSRRYPDYVTCTRCRYRRQGLDRSGGIL